MQSMIQNGWCRQANYWNETAKYKPKGEAAKLIARHRAAYERDMLEAFDKGIRPPIWAGAPSFVASSRMFACIHECTHLAKPYSSGGRIAVA